MLVTAQNGDTASALSYLFLSSTTPERTEPIATALHVGPRSR